MSGTIFPPGYVASGSTGAFFPAVPPPFPYSLPSDPFDIVISKFGQNLSWAKSHRCPCVNFRTDTSPAGSPNPGCLTCQGRGIYWDSPVDFVGLFTMTHQGAGGNEPGGTMNPRQGDIISGDPWLSVSEKAGVVWNEIGEFDLVIQLNGINRFNTTLYSGPSGNIYLPYQQGLYVAPSGAIQTWDSTTAQVIQVTGYTVSGSTVSIPNSYLSGTPYVVEFQAAMTYVCFRNPGGLAHTRPFVQGGICYPKRFRLQALDLFLRDSGISNFGNPGQISV